ncbi:MAG: hypothetical protein GX119_03980 [Syntrophomonadaceae bacterium]|jgi:uncharacterized protein YycO|nr:hypothetical protein [Syntrophomonadaceae bacterium]
MNTDSIRGLDKLTLLLFPLLALIFYALLLSTNRPVFENRQAVMYAYIDSATQGNFGYGTSMKYANDISFAGLEEGDIILGGYPDCAYGRFSHVAMYIGNGQVIEAFVDYGVHIRPIYHFRDYKEVCLLRVEAEPRIKQQAVDYAQNLQGKMFYALAFKPGDRIWNCSKLIWRAYLEEGIDLDDSRDLWISPDIFYKSGQTSIIREKGY